MKGFHWTIVVLGIVVSISSIAFRADDPATSYDESEGAFTFIAPVRIDNVVVRPLAPRLRGLVTILQLQRVGWNYDAMAYETTTGGLYSSQFRLQLLTKTLLC